MFVSTTPSIDGMKIKEYRGIVFGEVICGIDFMKDYTARFTGFIGGRAKEYEEDLINARADVIEEMMRRATKIGADGLVGVKVDVQPINVGQKNDVMLMVVASGTAVVVE